MGTRTEHARGLFCFCDLATTDLDGATAFYTSLFGWEAERDEAYVHYRLDGHEVAGAYPHEGPPVWHSYVTVPDVDAITRRAPGLGGSVVAPPRDVTGAGRVAYLADPAGAAVGAWTPKGRIGAELVNEPGTLTWNDLTTPDIDAVAGFYRELFGWSVELAGLPGGIDEDGEPIATEPIEGAPRYAVVKVADRMNGGMFEMAGMPSAWRPFFVTEDINEGMGRIAELGGKAVIPPTDVPAGKMGVFQDPQGAAFSLFEGETQD